MKASAAPKHAFSTTTTMSGESRSRSRASSIPTALPCGPTTGRVGLQLHRPGVNGDDLTIYGDGSQTRSFCYVDDLIDGFVRLMASPSPRDRALSIWATPVEFTIAGTCPARMIEPDWFTFEDRPSRPARSTIRASAAPNLACPLRELELAAKGAAGPRGSSARSPISTAKTNAHSTDAS